MTIEEIEKELSYYKSYHEITNESFKMICPNEISYKNFAIKYYCKNQFKYNIKIGKICQLNEEKYYNKLMEYSLQKMMPYPYHLIDIGFFNSINHSDKLNPPKYYAQLIKKLLNEGLPFDRLPAFTARDVFRFLGVSRNQFTEIANRYKSEKRKPWWIIRTYSNNNEGKLTTTEKSIKECLDKEIYLSNVFIIIPVEEKDSFIPIIHDNIIITRTTKMEYIYYRILLLIDDRLTIKDLMSILIDPNDPLILQKKEEIIKAISYLVRLNRLNKVEIRDIQCNGIIPTPRINQQTKKRVCFIVDEAIVSTLMTGITKTDDIKRIVVHLFETGRLTNDQVYALICLIELLKTQPCAKDSRAHYKKFFNVANSLVNIIKSLQQLICNEEVFGLCDGIEIIKMECLKYLTEKEKENYRMKYTSALIGSNSKIISCQHTPFCPQLIPHSVFSSYLFTIFLNYSYNSGISTLILPKGSFLQSLPNQFHQFNFILSTTFTHRQDIVSTSNALLFLNETLKSQPIIIHGLQFNKPHYENIIFPIEFSQSPLKKHPIIQKLSSDLTLSKFVGKIVLINTTENDFDLNKFDNWEFFDIVFGIPMDCYDENQQCVNALPSLLIENSKEEMWETSSDIVQVFFQFLSKNGFDYNSLNNQYILKEDILLYPSQPILFEKKNN
ncbi:hypothetical protein EHI_101270 [Entamoeba histolytica HM-1:IMSS]|uniref:FAM91 N-terminal domain-containing protein n=3 Tax=Entamoeba histolytica TaxID=5759 RepID=B1N485_ENTH1|nr:hypothetical protein EHI_101270 [Entamoeba histolytica HM-1:IMSS]EDS89223.1 hypothetical protein EHI_101270 [Entamoeba histolytica HM-1:IMSS]EMD43554.1 Hypothetical protein EHI5A_067690 [Entamoeba histolytica KU27]ENY62385.1 hypothetical protein EHI7A_104660 [Entamoeba histolytica HM-1:IMSS-A]|eukprot:XP_001914001.1 hypothetical protein EHI_101270 [Entamoeba histolytica HM-1:IMSS]